MADIRLSPLAPGAHQAVACTPDSRFIFDFSTAEATMTREGDNLVFTFDDGASLELTDFYTAFSSENMPDFEVDGATISGADFFMAMNEPDLMPAAGPAAGPVTGGARYHEYANAGLMDGVDRLGGLDLGFGRAEEPEYDLYGFGGEASGPADGGVVITPMRSGELDPDVPVIPTPGGNDDGNNLVGLGPDVLGVREFDLRDGGTSSAGGGMTISAPDGVAAIAIGGVTVWENGALVPGAVISTDEGHLTVDGFNPATGELTYTYHLTSPSGEHGQPGQDRIAHDLRVQVTDADGDTGFAVIRVVIEDDVPEAGDDAVTVAQGQTVEGSVLGNDTHGADGAADGAAVLWNVPEGTPEGSDDKGRYYEVKVDGGGTAKLYANGDYAFTADALAPGADPGELALPPFSYTIVDADGDRADAALNIAVTVTRPGVAPDPDTPVDPSLPAGTMASIVADEGVQPQHGGTGHGREGSGSFTINLNGETGGKCGVVIGNEDANSFVITFPDNGEPLVTARGSLVVNGVVITGVTVSPAPDAAGNWTLTYTYKVDGHGNHSQSADGQTLHGNIAVTVSDASGDTASGLIHVELHDDVPQFSVDSTGSKTDLSGSFGLNYGADHAASANALTAEGATKTEVSGETTTFTFADGVLTVTGNETSGYSYEFTPAENKTFDKTITLKATDGDTDTDTITLTVGQTVPVITLVDTEIIVDEGTQPEHGGAGHGQKGTGSFVVDLNGEAQGTITVGGITITIRDGAVDVTGVAEAEHGVKLAIKPTDVTQADGKWNVAYTYEYDADSGQTHGPDGSEMDQTLSGTFDIKVTDADGNTATGQINLEVHDDMPTIATGGYTGHRVTDPTPQVSLDFCASGVGDFSGFTTGWNYNHSGYSKIEKNSVQIIATNVRYNYADDHSHVVDYVYDENGNSLASNGWAKKELSISQDGLGVGNTWGGSDIGTNPGDPNLAEALVIENKNGSVSYGINLEFGHFENGDKALITFMLTPRNNNDDAVVFSREVSYADIVNGKIHIEVPDGFTKVFISALPGDPGADGKTSSSAFTVKTLEMTRPSWEHEGSFKINPGADGVADANNDGIPDSFSWDVDFGKFGNPPTVKITGAPGSGVYQLVEGPDSGDPYVKIFNLSGMPNGTNGTNLDGNALFIVRVDPETGKWTVDQFYNFDLENGNNPTFDIKFWVTDTDGDTTQASQTVNADLSEMLDRFQNVVDVPFDGGDTKNDTTDSILTGTEVNDLMYGRGGHDILFGDEGNNFATTLSNELRPTWPGGWVAAPAQGYKEIWFRLNNSKPNAVDKNGLNLETILTNVEKAEGAGGDDALFGGLGNDILFGGAGNDYLYGNGKNKGTDFSDRDMLFGGSGNDILVYDGNDAIIHGGSDIDILLVGKDGPTLSNMLTEGNNDSTRPYVGGIEVLLRSLKTNHVENLGITSLASLAAYGVTIDNDNHTLILSDAWHETADGYKYHNKAGEALISIETTNDVTVTVEPPKTDAHAETGAEQTAHVDDVSVLSALGREGADADGADSLNSMSGHVDAPVTGTPDAPAADAQAFAVKPAEPSRMAAADNAEEPKSEGTDGDDLLFGGSGADTLSGGTGDDYLNGGEGRDALLGGDGDDLIVYDASDYLVHGGSGIDFLLSGENDMLHLQDLLDNTDPGKGPLVSDVEVLLKGDGLDSLTRLQDLGQYGITVEGDRLNLGDGWSGSEGTYTYKGDDGKSITLETTLTAEKQADGSIAFTYDPASEQSAQEELMTAINTMQAGTGSC